MLIDIDDIVVEEWKQFQNVENEGGRAGCQDNWPEFYRMRASQFLNWPEAVLESYYSDLVTASEEGSNLLSNKYAFMMKDTAPERFKAIEEYLPPQSEDKLKKIKKCVAAHVKWAEEFFEKYPKMAMSGRKIHKSDTCWCETSIETYIEGELLSYGEETINLYEAFINRCLRENRNLAIEDRENMAKFYGYNSLKELEENYR